MLHYHEVHYLSGAEGGVHFVAFNNFKSSTSPGNNVSGRGNGVTVTRLPDIRGVK